MSILRRADLSVAGVSTPSDRADRTPAQGLLDSDDPRQISRRVNDTLQRERELHRSAARADQRLTAQESRDLTGITLVLDQRERLASRTRRTCCSRSSGRQGLVTNASAPASNAPSWIARAG